MILGLNVAIPVVAISAGAVIHNNCDDPIECNYPFLFHAVWTLVPIASLLTATLLPRPLRAYLAAFFAAGWALLTYIAWAGMPGLLILPSLLWGTAAALVLFILIWLRDERTT